MTETLTDAELDLIFFIERFAATKGQAPTDDDVKRRFNGLTDEFLKGFKRNPLVQRSFKARGINYPGPNLTDVQMHAIAAMLDPYDRRSDEKKLRDIGVTTRQWSTWLLDDEFAIYLNDRSERLLENTKFEANKGIIKGARNGNLAAAKLHHEITGRYRPGQEEQIDVRRLLHTFIEIIQRHVRDPVVMHNIAMEISQAANAESLSTGLTNQIMSGAQNVRDRTIAGSSVRQSSIPIPRSIGGADDD